jgi:hypothetical protein
MDVRPRIPKSCLVLAALVVAGTVGGGAFVAIGARAAPTPFELYFDGAHRGLSHFGPFTSTAPFCAAGTVADIRQYFPATSRKYACDDGSGSLVILVDNFPDEHVTGGKGAWKISAGTGRYAKLRGSGSWTGLSWTGNPQDPTTITFRTKMQGTVDFDEVAPALGITRASAKRLAKPAGSYLVKVVFVARDGAGGAVSFHVKAKSASRTLGTQMGETSTGTGAVSITVRPPRGARTLRLELTGSDEVGNAASAAVRSVPLPR